MSSTRRRWSSASRTAPCTWGTQRSEYGSWTLCAEPWWDVWRPEPRSRWRSSAATATWPGCGRASWYGAENATSVPSSASTDIAAATDAVRDSRSASASEQRPERAHQLRAVEERQPLLRLERQRLEAGLPQRDQRRHHLPVELHLAAPDERQREVRERREVAGRADAPLLRHDRVDPERQELADPVHEQRPAPGVAERERVRAQQQHRPHDLARERAPDAGGVRGDEVLLEPGGVLGRDERRGEVAEARSSPRRPPRPGATSVSMTSRASCMRSRAWTSRATRAPCAGHRLDVGDRQVGAGQDDEVARSGAGVVGGSEVGVGHRAEDSQLSSRSHRQPDSPRSRRPVLAFIDQIVIPFLTSLYGAVGYLGVMLAMAIESAMIPLPVGADPAVRRLPRLRPTAIEPLTGQPWNFWIVVLVATIGNTLGSLIAYAIGAWGGRPFLERYGRYLLIRPHEIEVADEFFRKYGAPTVFFGRLLPIVRTFISFPAGVTRMPIGKFILFSTAGALPWSIALVYAGMQLGANWEQIREALQPFDMLIVVAVVVLFLGLLWWRLGMPGRPKREQAEVAAAEPETAPPGPEA